MDGKTNGGVFAPQNLQLFSYTRNNPVNYIDPDGKRWTGILWRILKRVPGAKKHLLRPLSKAGNYVNNIPARVGNYISKTTKRISNIFNKSSQVKISGRVQTRINIAEGVTRTTPLRKSGEFVQAGFKHVIDGHFNRAVANSRSIFTISPDKLKVILQSKTVVQSSVTKVGDQFVRVVDTGHIVGRSALKYGGTLTRKIAIFTDKAGNLITTYPVK